MVKGDVPQMCTFILLGESAAAAATAIYHLHRVQCIFTLHVIKIVSLKLVYGHFVGV